MGTVIDFTARKAQRDQAYYESDAAFVSFDNMLGNLDDLLDEMEQDYRNEREQFLKSHTDAAIKMGRSKFEARLYANRQLAERDARNELANKICDF